MTKITSLSTHDLRFPTSAHARRLGRHEPRSGLLGRLCRARHRRPGLEGHGLTFTIGRGNEIVLRRHRGADARCVVGLDLDWTVADEHGPRSGATSPATASCAGSAPTRAPSTSPPARWSTPSGTCWAKTEPASRVWRLVADMTPEAVRRAASTSATSPTASRRTRRWRMLARKAAPARPSASPSLEREGYPATRPRPAGSATTTRSSRRLVSEAVDAGFNHVKLKVGRDLRRRHPPARDRPRGASGPTAT